LPLGSPLSPARRRPRWARSGPLLPPVPVVAVRAARPPCSRPPQPPCASLCHRNLRGKMGTGRRNSQKRGHAVRRPCGDACGAGPDVLGSRSRLANPTAPRPPAILTTVGADSLIVVVCGGRSHVAEPRNVLGANPRPRTGSGQLRPAVPHLGEVVDDPTGSPGIVRQVRPGVVLELMGRRSARRRRDHSGTAPQFDHEFGTVHEG